MQGFPSDKPSRIRLRGSRAKLSSPGALLKNFATTNPKDISSINRRRASSYHIECLMARGAGGVARRYLHEATVTERHKSALRDAIIELVDFYGELLRRSLPGWKTNGRRNS